MIDQTRIDEATRYAASRLSDLSECVAEYRAEANDHVQEIPLDLEVLGNVKRDKYRVTVLLGTGGPHDELVYTVSGGGIDEVEYRYADWGWSHTVPLTRDQETDARDFLEVLLDVSDLSAYLS